MFIWIKVCIALWSFHQLLDTVEAHCKLRFTNTRPLVFKQFGAKVILLRQSLNEFNLYEGESISTFCSNGFEVDSVDLSRQYQNIIWKCQSDRLETNAIRTNHPAYSYQRNEITVGCQNGIMQQIFESKTHLADCVATATMLVVGTKVEPYAKDIKTAAFCYDLENLKLKFIAYTAYNTKQNYTKVSDTFNAVSDSVIGSKVHELDTLGLDQELLDFNKYFNFMTGNQFNSVEKSISQSNDFEFFSPELFEYDSLIQDVPLAKALEPYKDAFSIVWYKKLLYGNWRYFLNALRAHVTDNTNKYQVRLGTSDHIEVPSRGICNITKPLVFTYKTTEPNEESQANAPKYIWAHFRTLPVSSTMADRIEHKSTATENFVIIGFNSPYILTSEPDSFCDNICHRFPWLAASQFAKLHMRPLFGIVICCRAADVAHKLDNFPSSDFWLREDYGKYTTSTTENTSTLAITKVTNSVKPILQPEFSVENSIGSGNGFEDYNDDTE